MTESCCITKGTVFHSTMDANGVGHKGIGELDPVGLLSGQEFARYEAMMRTWLQRATIRAVNESISAQHASSEQFVVALRRNLFDQTSRVPREIRQFIRQQIRGGVEMGAAEIKMPVQLELMIDNIKQVAQEQISQLGKIANETTSSALAEVISTGLQEGQNVEALTRGVQHWAVDSGDMERAMKWRSRMIARTESSRALVSGHLESWKASGIVQQVEWMVAPSPCQFCERIGRDKPVVALGEPWFPFPYTLTGTKGGRMVLDYRPITGPPLHPHCRCAVKPLIDRK